MKKWKGVFDPDLTAAKLESAMKSAENPPKAREMLRFFKAGPGDCAEHDRFLGLPNPVCHRFEEEFQNMPLTESVAALRTSPFHEVRLCSLFILDGQYKYGSPELRAEIVRNYMECAALGRINNWDLVDLSAPNIIGEHELEHHDGCILGFASKDTLWEQRIAVVSTLTLIRHGELELTLDLSEKFMNHPHDLMHKACGWMLREVGKRDKSLLTSFIQKHLQEMPRIMLRYAIEHFSSSERHFLLTRDSQKLVRCARARKNFTIN